MGLKRWMFGSSEEISPDIKFGRYSDLYKDSSKKKSWDLALQASEANDYLNVYKHFIEYIRDDDAQNFASIKSDDDSLDFAFYQGSKVINVCINNEFIEAEAKIAKCINPHLEVFRSLLEDNYTLRYCKYCLDEEQNLTMVFQSNHKDANPYKLYYGLKELATIADHKDDALINKYSEFEAINNKHINNCTNIKTNKIVSIDTNASMNMRVHINNHINCNNHIVINHNINMRIIISCIHINIHILMVVCIRIHFPLFPHHSSSNCKNNSCSVSVPVIIESYYIDENIAC